MLFKFSVTKVNLKKFNRVFSCNNFIIMFFFSSQKYIHGLKEIILHKTTAEKLFLSIVHISSSKFFVLYFSIVIFVVGA